MFYRKNEYDASEQAPLLVTDPHQAEIHTDNKVRALVEQEFSLMDQEHTRIRVEALAARLGGKGNTP